MDEQKIMELNREMNERYKNDDFHFGEEPVPKKQEKKYTREALLQDSDDEPEAHEPLD